MKTKAYIDPTMFELKDEDQIKKNIEFFQQIIKLCNNGTLNIIIYKDLLKKLQNRSIIPFPINVSNLSDSELKEQILLLNTNFQNCIQNAWFETDIEECLGDQEFNTTPYMKDEYYELLCIMNSTCYNCNLEGVNTVLIGELNNSPKHGFELKLTCSCLKKTFSEKYTWNNPKALLSIKDEQISLLKSIELSKINDPTVNRGDHHAPFSPGNHSIKRFSDIPSKSRIILNILRYFELRTITLKDFTPSTKEIDGTIIIAYSEENSTNSILYGKIYINGYCNSVELFFPCNVAKCIERYCDKKIDYKTITELATHLSLI